MIRHYFPHLMCCLISISIIGCAAVEWKHRHPAVKKGDPYALINEEELRIDNITSTIKGFYTNPSQDPDELKAPVTWDYSGGESFGKFLYTITPYGLMTLPFADLTGRNIAVPPGQLGIVIHRTYYKELSREKVVDIVTKSPSLDESKPLKIKIRFFKGKVLYRTGYGDDVMWSGNVMSVGNSEKYIISSRSHITLLNMNASNDWYKVLYETVEWDDIMWVDVEEGKKYRLELYSNKLIEPGGAVVARQELNAVKLPDDKSVERDQKIVTEKGEVLGRELIIESEEKIVIKDSDGTITLTISKVDEK